MSLDGFIGKSWKDIFKKHFISFDDDGYYWELYSTFEKIASKTGEMIDLYDGANFKGQTLLFLKQCLEKKLNEVKLKKDNWDVIVGWDMRDKKELLKTVSKDKMIYFLETFINNIDKAKR